MSLRRVPAVLRDDSGIRLGVAACLVVLSLTLEGCATKPTPRSGGKGASPSQSATTSSASPAAWRLPTQFVVLTSTQQVPEVAAIIVHDAKQPQHPGGPNASYQLVAGLAAAVDTAQPKKESERIARAFEQLCQPGAPRVDVWVEGLVGLLVPI